MLNLSDCTWKQIAELDKARSILFITMAPIEEHSLHLPLGTDVYEGEYWIAEAEGIINQKNPEAVCCKLPAYPIAAAGVRGFYGCIHFEPKTVYKVAVELLENIVQMGFQNIIIVASHGDPIHLIATEKACKRINSKYKICAISPMGAFFSAKELGIDLGLPDEIKEMERCAANDFHAGWIETSCMLDINKASVSESYKTIPPIEIHEKDMMFSGKQLRAMGEYGHLGYPALGDEKIGRMLNCNTAQYLATVASKLIKGEDCSGYMFHSLYKIPFMHTPFL
ncbi:creatininase family protein [Anaerocolumna chitinilytica]|uniref:Creatininase family protein n=1 Tax=Anaerocolumna chitinilytica TaxID=1727145 RepID=A0A7I8DV74_9FIRM|nr:creatininase family protein [Anaerocolumna chitinilytica]BCK01026.1 hypothetical protein bsdcttw_40660 [Anaerocolumna chitinilytica]